MLEPTALARQETAAIAPGFYENMSFEDYAAQPGINGSSIVHMRRSPMFYKFMRDNPQSPTPAMILGTATHRMILEPDRVGDFAVWDQETQGRRFGRVWDAFKEANADKLILTATERDAMVGMAVGARRNAPIRKYADIKGRCEVSMFWDFNGKRYKGRVDKLCEGHVIFDLKTTRDCRAWKFSSQAFQLAYHIKMALYWSGYRSLAGKEPKMRLGAIESKAPHESAVYRITPDVLALGLEELQELEQKLAVCESRNEWPAAETEEIDLQLPKWATTDSDGDFEIEGLDLE